MSKSGQGFYPSLALFMYRLFLLMISNGTEYKTCLGRKNITPGGNHSKGR